MQGKPAPAGSGFRSQNRLGHPGSPEKEGLPVTRVPAVVALLYFLLLSAAVADGPQDNLQEKVRPIPPKGVAIKPEERKSLEEDLQGLGREIAELPGQLKGQPALLELLPDVEVFARAVRSALEHGEFYDPGEGKLARQLLAEGRDRARQLRDGKPVFPAATGLVVRGYRSRIDGSAQPYGLVVPSAFRPGDSPRRLDVWLHGRDEKLTELRFLGQRLRQAGPFVPAGAFVLHPYGRYCNAFKFAGEVDVLEALDHARKHYPVDDDRVVMRGFSMGGAGCWQFAVHYPDRWAAAAPGAGFSETPRFLRVFQDEKLAPTDFERTLWRLYDCDGWAGNLFNLPTVAYFGEKDRQKQAADVMAEALKREGIELVHVLGPGTGHSYHPRAKAEIDRRIDRLAAQGRPRVPEVVRFTTYTIRYDRCYWVRLDALGRHWEKATVEASLSGGRIRVQSDNVEALTLSFGPGECPLPFARLPIVEFGKDKDRQIVRAGVVGSDRSWSASFVKDADGKWRPGSPPAGLRKRHGLQGPIDDAFLDSFLMVRPTGKGWHEKTADWARAEMNHAVAHWRSQFRGEARVKDDVAVTDEDIAAHNLVLWGDPGSNAVLAKLAAKLPVGWDSKEVRLGKAAFPAGHHVPVLICPNPLNPERYVVVNSGFTFREYDYLNNARQVPKLPDYAVLDVRTPPSPRWPGKVVRAGFFDEGWRLPAGGE
jgi:dienelactone hydrolase